MRRDESAGIDPVRRIILLGGGFSTDPDSLLDEYVLSASAVDKPRVCFIPTASGDSRGYTDRFYSAFTRMNCTPSHLWLFHDRSADMASLVANQDILYVGGGSTANLLALWRLHGLDRLIRDAYRRGVLLCGISAGAACWFDACLTDSFGDLRPLKDGLGLLEGSFCPHFDAEPERDQLYGQAVSDGSLPGGWALQDGAAALFRNEELRDIVTRNGTSTIIGMRRENGYTQISRKFSKAQILTEPGGES
ncbi:Type 1 glutamine amidotransferase-like domain-containing protein [Nocardia vaccinii]|uniref:Type 1 glutamine amidotransferase-like domain-containing protein n=1 Tax=Nocardia vaccinii TaxID=1822 RepID=UPI000AB0AD7C|nr:peptidase E [Nocardia vaccinii]